MRHLVRRAGLPAVLCLLLAGPALAQIDAPRPVDELTPDSARRRDAPRARRTEPAADSSDDTSADGPTPHPEPATPAPRPTVRPTLPVTPPEPPRAAAPDARRVALPPLVVPTQTDADLLGAFRAWQRAHHERSAKAAESAITDLAGLREDLAIGSLAPVSEALVRAAAERRLQRDPAGAVVLARHAVQLSPELLDARLGLFRAEFAEDPFQVRRLLAELLAAARAGWADPRTRAALLGNAGTALLFAWIGTALAVLLVLFLRTAPNVFHDVHHLFPRAVARWQSAALVLLLVSLPFVFRLGVALGLLSVFAASTLYLRRTERWLAVLLLASVTVVPFVAGRIARATTFAQTAAEEAWLVDEGGLEANGAAERIRARTSSGRPAEWAESFALGRFAARRGALSDAGTLLRGAAGRRADARVLTNLGNVLYAQGEVPRAAEQYVRATELDPTLAAAFWDLSKLYRRRARTLLDDAVGPELDRAQTVLATAQRLDDSLITRADPPDDRALTNRLLLFPAVPTEELLALADGAERERRVSAQLSGALLGDIDPVVATVLPLLLGGALAALGFARAGRGVSSPCEKCGRAVCGRCDPELAKASRLCHQCVNVFARRGVVPPLLRMNKEIEVRRYAARSSRLAYGLGLLCSGLGHLFAGFPLLGAVWAFLFLFAASCAALRDGMLRAPYGGVPAALCLLPVLVLLAAVYLASLRGLARRRA